MRFLNKLIYIKNKNFLKNINFYIKYNLLIK